MRFLDPKTDFAFKKLFGGEDSKLRLINLLNSVLALPRQQQISQVEIIDPYLAPKIKGIKDTYVDVKATDQQGTQFIIEMQVLSVAYFEKRVLYNACKAYSSQLKKAEDYATLNKTIAITFTDFVMFKEVENIKSTVLLKNQHNQLYSEDLSLVFLELPKFTNSEKELTTDLDRWLYFLRHADDLSMIPKEYASNPLFKGAFDCLNESNMTNEELDIQEKKLFFLADQKRILTEKKQLESKLEQAIINMLDKNISVADIAQIMQISVETVKQIVNRDSDIKS